MLTFLLAAALACQTGPDDVSPPAASQPAASPPDPPEAPEEATPVGQLTLPQLGAPPWEGATRSQRAAVLEGCGADQLFLCAQQRAAEAAQQDAWQQAGLCCLAGVTEAGSAYGSCLQTAALAAVSPRRPSGLPTALRLCAFSGELACPPLVLAKGAPLPPPADQPAQDPIDRALAIPSRIRLALDADPQAAERCVDLFWAIWVQASFSAAEAISGDLLAALPPEAQPHVRFSAAHRWLSIRRGLPHLDEATVELKSLLTRRNPLSSSTQLAETPAPLPPAAGSWRRLLPGEETIPSAHCGGPSLRAVSHDETLDLQLALLEAAGRLDPPPPPSYFYGEGRANSPLALRWTAIRLGSQLYPYRARNLHDPDPQLQRRIASANPQAAARFQQAATAGAPQATAAEREALSGQREQALRASFTPHQRNAVLALDETRHEDLDSFMELLALEEGMAVADIGCGSGFFTFPIAARVGPRGVVHAVDIETTYTLLVEARALSPTRNPHQNVRVVNSAPDDVRLAPESIDLALMAHLDFLCNHRRNEGSQERRMLDSVHRSLKPGGRIVALQYLGRLPQGSLETLRDNLLDAGLTLEQELSYPEHKSIVVVVRRPAD